MQGAIILIAVACAHYACDESGVCGDADQGTDRFTFWSSPKRKIAWLPKALASCAMDDPLKVASYAACQSAAAASCTAAHPTGPACYAACQSAAAAGCGGAAAPGFAGCYSLAQKACINTCGSAGFAAFTACYSQAQAQCSPAAATIASCTAAKVALC